MFLQMIHVFSAVCCARITSAGRVRSETAAAIREIMAQGQSTFARLILIELGKPGQSQLALGLAQDRQLQIGITIIYVVGRFMSLNRVAGVPWA
jgi:hypothetical protein